MSELVLRVEAGGRVLGEFVLGDGPFALRLIEAPTGRLVSVLTIAPGEAAPVVPDLYRDKTVDLTPREAEVLLQGLPSIPAPDRPAPEAGSIARRSEPERVPGTGRFELPSDALPGFPSGEGGHGGVSWERAPFDGEPEGTESPATGLPPAGTGPAAPEADRSVTRSLPGPAFDALHAADEPGAEGRPTRTDPLPSEEHARPTYVDSPVHPASPAPDTSRHAGAPCGFEGSIRSAGPTIVPTDFAEEDEAVTVVARPQEGDVAQAARAGGRSPGEYDEVPVHHLHAADASPDDLSLGMSAGTDSHSSTSGAWDELPVPDRRSAGPDDDLSLSLPFDPARTDAAISDLSLSHGVEQTSGMEGERSLSLPLPDGNLYGPSEDDDLSLPVPESLLVEPPAPPVGDNLMASSLGFPQVVPPRVDTTGGFERDQSTERLEGAEVWFRRSGEWTPRGALSLGQHVQAFGGMVRCDDRGGLVVLAGPRLHGSATLPSGELRQIQSGQQAVQLPAGTSVILWQGEQGIYVRSNVPAEVSGSLLDSGPVVYRRPPRSRSWQPPRSDLEDEGT